jgi:hypothetical protein
MEREKGHYLGDRRYSAIAHAVVTKDVCIMEKLIDDSLRTDLTNKGLMTCATCSLMQVIAECTLMLPLLVRIHYHVTGDKE